MIKSNDFKRIVVKVGTSTLTHDSGMLNLRRINELVRVLSDLKNAGADVVLVSSGAVGVGSARLGIERPQNTCEKQAAAAVGQCALMHMYDKMFAEFGHVVAQVLLTRSVINDEPGRRNVTNALAALFRSGAIPIVNENDVISTFELENMACFGDNDTLAAVVSCICGADLLIILSDIDGLYDGDPRENSDARIIPIVRCITDDIRALAGGAGSAQGTGGMATKIAAAELVMKHGIHMVIANGEKPEIIYDICNARIRGTLFSPKEDACEDSE